MDSLNSVSSGTFNVSTYGQKLGGEIISQTLDSMNQYGSPPSKTGWAGATGNTNNTNTTTGTATGTNTNGAGSANSMSHGSTSQAMSKDYNFQKSFLSNSYLENGTGALVTSTA